MSEWYAGIEYEQNLDYLPSIVWEPMDITGDRYQVVQEDNSKSVWCAMSIGVKAEQSRTSIYRVSRGVNIVRG